MGKGETACFIFFGVGKGTGLIAEIGDLQQRVGQGGAVDRYKAMIFPRRQMMNGPGEKLFAGAARPFNQHVAAALGYQWKQVEQSPHLRASTDNVLERVAAVQLFLQLFNLAEVLKGFHPTDDLAGVIF